jgi:hypothetical protein
MQQEIDHLVDKCSNLKHQWNNDQCKLFQEIDQWENDSIENIKKEADLARSELQQFEQSHDETFEQILENINQCKQSNNYSEINLIQWKKQLNHLQSQIKIKLNNKHQLEHDQQNVKRLKTNSSSTDETFYEVFGQAKLYRNNLIATNNIYCRSFISGQNSYSIGKHSFTIKIERVNKRDSSCFFGLMTSNETMKEPFSDMKSVYGVWSSGYDVTAGQKSNADRFKRWKEEDIVTFTFHCDTKQFIIENKRIDWCSTFDIDINFSPFPWKFLAIIKGYRLRILHHS